MNIETFLLCDAATDSMGKLNVLGAFDALNTQNFPFVLPQCSVAVRIRLQRIEQGAHKITIHFIDDDGKFVIPPFDGGFEMNVGGNERSGVANMIINLQNLNFDHAGEYALVLAVDGKEISRLPLQVRKIS
ncbi:MAG: hypothetical protein HY864_15465 [Chloroflexi bacterium]|nr:hypothetical protein [Chloroflexota bacterium]